jgi:uncharacterized membrane protein YfcA
MSRAIAAHRFFGRVAYDVEISRPRQWPDRQWVVPVSESWIYPLMFGVALIAGAIDAIAGGGGLITVPALLSMGLSPPLALGTNKLQSTFGSVSATWHYRGAGLVRLRDCRIGIIATLLGASLGALSVQWLNPDVLRWLIPWLLLGVIVYTLLRPRAGDGEGVPRLPVTPTFVGLGLAIGFYDGFLGPGTGSFWTLALISLLGQNFLKATATTKVMNASSNVASLAIFIAGGKVVWAIGLVMGLGQLVGARLGAQLAVRGGTKFVRPVFLTVVTLLLARLLFVQFR